MNTPKKKWTELLDNKENNEGYAGTFEVELRNPSDLELLRTELEETQFEFLLGFTLVILLSGAMRSSIADSYPYHSYIRMKSDKDAMLFKLSVRI